MNDKPRNGHRLIIRQGPVERAIEIADGHLAIDINRAVRLRADALNGAVVLVLDFADDFFKNIFKRDDALDRSIFIDDERQLFLFAFEIVELFGAEWAPKIGADLPPSTLGYLASRACHVEAMSEGRLATSIEDILLRAIVCFAVRRPELDILEIGTLFGIGAAIMHDALAPHFRRVRLSLLDPLDGYYASEKKDILTGQPVNEAVLKRNLRRGGVNDEDVTIIKRLSTDAEAIEAAALRAYDVLVIDGDHSYDGVKFDFDHYAPLVRPGGLIVIDDYHSPDWPDVTRFVDDEVARRKGFSLFGASWRTCVYKADE